MYARECSCARLFFPLRTRVKAALETKGRDERSVKIASFEQKKRKAENKNIFLNRCKCRTRNDDNDDGSDDDDDDGNGVRWRRQRRRRTWRPRQKTKAVLNPCIFASSIFFASLEQNSKKTIFLCLFFSPWCVSLSTSLLTCLVFRDFLVKSLL